MKVVIAGSRSVTDYELVKSHIEMSKFEISEVVSGIAQGVDKLGERWAKENGVPIKQFEADWLVYGKAAGPIRNGQMAKYADAAIILIDKSVISSGSRNMVSQIEKQGKPRYVVYLDGKKENED